MAHEVIARDLSGVEYLVMAQSELDLELNGNQTLQLTITPNQVNDKFIDEIDAMWEIDYYGNTYKVVYTKKESRGQHYFVDVRATHHALDKLDSIRIYERFDGYLTPDKGFSMVFSAETGYSFKLLDVFSAVEIEGFGNGDTNLSCFKTLLDRYKAEFYISGRVIYITRSVGRDTDFEYRYKLNASDVSEETDGASAFTYVKGYGDYAEGEENFIKNAKIKREYTSPLAAILGRRHAPVVAKGSYKLVETIDAAMKEVVDNSVSISVSANVSDLRDQGYPYTSPELGDRVFLSDSRIGFHQEVRVIDLKIERYANGKVRNIGITFGNERLRRSYASRLSSAMKGVESIMNGKAELKFNVLDQRSKEVIQRITTVGAELTLDDGIFAVDKNNVNKIVGLKSDGWFISRDGGNTTTTVLNADGLNASMITSGYLSGDRVRSGTLSTSNSSIRWNLDGSSLQFSGSSTIEFSNANNSLIRQANGVSAFLNFSPTTQGTASPGVLLGTNNNGKVDGIDKKFVGFKAQAAQSASDSSLAQTEIFGNKTIFDGYGATEFTGRWAIEMSSPSSLKRHFYPIDTNKCSYYLGKSDNMFSAVYTNSINDYISVSGNATNGGLLTSKNGKFGIKFSDTGIFVLVNGVSYDLSKAVTT